MKSGTPRQRPLSPHLLIYRPTITMTMSILHRLTGVALYVGTLIVAWSLVAIAWGPGAFGQFEGFIASPLGWVILLGYTWAFIHHLLGGLRHLLFDAGVGFDLRVADILARANLFGSVGLTGLIWIAPHVVQIGFRP
jgi:succinate dehydrogenase / fumarate reductase cytochrome b subunit